MCMYVCLVRKSAFKIGGKISNVGVDRLLECSMNRRTLGTATQRSGLPNNPYLMPQVLCACLFVWKPYKASSTRRPRKTPPSLSSLVSSLKATTDAHSSWVIGCSQDAAPNQRLNARWLSRRTLLDRLSSIVRASHGRLAQKPFGENQTQPLSVVVMW